MSENTDWVILSNEMRVQKNLVGSKKKIQSAKPVRPGMAAPKAIKKRKNNKPVRQLTGNPERPNIDPYRNLQNKQKPKKKKGKVKTKNRKTRKDQEPPVFSTFPRTMIIGSYIKKLSNNTIYKIIDRGKKYLLLQNLNKMTHKLTLTCDPSLVITSVSNQHIEAMKQDGKDIKHILLEGPISESIEIIKATMNDPMRYGLLDSYLVPSVLNNHELEIWKARVRTELGIEESDKPVGASGKRQNARNYTVVRPQDFVVKVQTFSCSAKGHALESIQAEIITRPKGSKKLSSVCIPAGYCEQCKRHYILSSILESYSDSLKYALCDFVESKELNQYLFNMSRNTERFAGESTLRKCGYTVSEQSRLTDIERVKLLNQIIDWEILSREKVKSFLNWLITFQSSNPLMKRAIQKWRYDLQEISKTPKGRVVLVKKVIG